MIMSDVNDIVFLIVVQSVSRSTYQLSFSTCSALFFLKICLKVIGLNSTQLNLNIMYNFYSI